MKEENKETRKEENRKIGKSEKRKSTIESM
jgi:hypothetical protein